MDLLQGCREGLEKVRQMLAADKLLSHEQMDQAIAIIRECERLASGHGNVLVELHAVQLKVPRCELKGEFLDFLEAQYRARGLSNPRKIATLVVMEEASNALKRAVATTMEQMRRSSAA